MDRRRSPRLHPRIHAREEGAGMERRRSPRLHHQIQSAEEGGGVTRRRSTRLHPQINAGEEGAGVIRRRGTRHHPQIEASKEGAGGTKTRRSRRRRGSSPAEPASLPDGDDMLREILLRLPPQPSSLPRASAVCRRWRGLVTDPKFLHQFYGHHREPPLVGVFERLDQGFVFTSVLDPPDHIPRQRFDLGRYSGSRGYNLLDCRHGLVLVEDSSVNKVFVFNPITGEQRGLAIPPKFRRNLINGAVLCAAGDHGHVHGACHLSPFKVVLVSTVRSDNRSLASVYSSETGIWGNLVSDVRCQVLYDIVSLIGNCLYWLSSSDDILEFDLGENSLTVIMEPPITNNGYRLIVKAENGAIGFAKFCYPHFHVWQRNINYRGVATWASWKTIEMHSILGIPPRIEGQVGGRQIIQGYDEDTDVLFVNVDGTVYMVNLKSSQSRKLYETSSTDHIYPFKSFYAPGTTIAGGSNRAEILHNQ